MASEYADIKFEIRGQIGIIKVCFFHSLQYIDIVC